MAITTLPSAPSITDPANFESKANALVIALDTFVTETNNAITALNSISTNATSSTSLSITSGIITLTTQSGKSYVPGMSVKIAITSAGQNWMLGDVTAYNSSTGSLTVNVSGTNGSGTSAAWTISQSSPGTVSPGANNNITSLNGLTTALSITQGGTGASTASAARTNLGAAASGINTDITSLSLTTPLSISQGGTGASTASAARTALGVGNKVSKFTSEFTSGTAGGTTTANTNYTRILNTTIINEISATLNTTTGVVTVPAGTYILSAGAVAHKVNYNRITIKDSSTVYATGNNSYASSSDPATSQSLILGQKVTFPAPVNIFINHFTKSAVTTNGLGYPLSIATVPEVYAYLTIEQVS